jgi:hypothetical protein
MEHRERSACGGDGAEETVNQRVARASLLFPAAAARADAASNNKSIQIVPLRMSFSKTIFRCLDIDFEHFEQANLNNDLCAPRSGAAGCFTPGPLPVPGSHHAAYLSAPSVRGLLRTLWHGRYAAGTGRHTPPV